MKVVAALCAVACLATICQRVDAATFDDTHPAKFNVHYLTRDGRDGYNTAATPGRLSVTAPRSNGGGNTRVIIYPPAQPMSVDQQACATWSAQAGINVQQGIALRVRHDIEGSGRWRAVTVMKNVMWGAHWNFNVITWDTRAGYRWRNHGSVSLPQVFWPNHVLAPLPWRVCARVQGDLVTVKAWRTSEVEPAWGDKSHGGTVRIPSEWTYSGKSGWYLGHVPPGGSATMQDLVADRVPSKP